MDAKGEKFDEAVHEAVTQVPASAPEQKGLVIDVVEKGYYLNDKVLRYAKVVVAC
jgi:molecular chaperone GrpE